MPPHAENSSSAFDYRSLLPSRSSSSKNNHLPESAIDSQDNHNNNGDPPSSWLDDYTGTGCTELSFRERMLGFGTCMVAGYLLSFGSMWRIRDLIFGNPVPLVVHTLVGNLLSWAGSFFLVGPTAQWKAMWEEKRKLATQIYLVSLVVMLMILFVNPPGPVGLYLLILILLQNGAIAWYCISYIPFAQETIVSWVKRFVSINNVGNDLNLSSYAPAPV